MKELDTYFDKLRSTLMLVASEILAQRQCEICTRSAAQLAKLAKLAQLAQPVQLAIMNCSLVPLISWFYEEHLNHTNQLSESVESKLIDHWKCYPNLSHDFLTLTGCFYIFIGMLGIASNLLVLHTMLSRRLTKLSDYLIVNLIVTDVLMLVMNVPQLVVNCLHGRWMQKYAIFCSLYGFFGSLFGSVSIMTFVAIAIDRYFAIVPAFNVQKIEKNKILPIVVGVWTYSILWTIPPFFGWNEYVLEGGLVSCSFNYLSTDHFNRSYILSLFVAVYCLPLVIIVFCYTSIMMTVYSVNRQLKSLVVSGDEESATEKHSYISKRTYNIKSEYKMFKIFVFGIVLWFLAWTPYAIVALIGFFGDEFSRSQLTPVMVFIPSIFVKIASCYNPILFVARNPIIWHEIKCKFKKVFLGKRSANKYPLCCMNKSNASEITELDTIVDYRTSNTITTSTKV